MRRIYAGAIGFIMSVSAVRTAAALDLKGSDTLEEVTKDAVGLCSLGGLINYVGGGSGTGQAAMAAGTQQIAPMSRELNGTACAASASQLLIGLDGISIITSNQFFGDSVDQTAEVEDNCSDSVNGGTTLAVPGCVAADGCATAGQYAFTDWKDVLAMVYGGQNHTTAAQLIGGARNPARINCAGAVRQALVNNWAAVFTDSILDPQPCRATSCLRLKHAFRRGDQSGTTDTFVSLVGLVPIPPFTTVAPGVGRDPNATANPFCNAGTNLMSKGDADYLDLDPIRRIVDSDVAANGRLGFEQVAQGYQAPSNPPVVVGVDDRVEPPVTIMNDYSMATEQNILPDASIAGSAALQVAALPQRKGLGVVLPIEVPGNYTDERIAYFSTIPLGGEPVICAPGKFAPSIADLQHPSTALCPNGKNQPCLLPVNVDNPAAPSFNCLNNSPVPAAPPLKDARVYNLLVLDSTGHYVRDNYVNPNLTLSATRQNRVVSAFFRLHISQVTNLGATAPGINCKKFTSTEQIGCLVSASPCSIGFAGRESVDNALNIAAQVAGIKVTATNIQNLVTSQGPVYPLSRRLWVNSITGFSTVSGDQLSLLRCFQGQVPGIPLSDIDLVVQRRNFVAVPAGVSRTKGCPAVFP
jgi:ABC-type phosphate transport system substrate-binding protein